MLGIQTSFEASPEMVEHSTLSAVSESRAFKALAALSIVGILAACGSGEGESQVSTTTVPVITESDLPAPDCEIIYDDTTDFGPEHATEDTAFTEYIEGRKPNSEESDEEELPPLPQDNWVKHPAVLNGFDYRNGDTYIAVREVEDEKWSVLAERTCVITKK